jgi:hypothetical protein
MTARTIAKFNCFLKQNISKLRFKSLCKLKFLLFLPLLFSKQAMGQRPVYQKVIAAYDSTRVIAPREKLYVHFDKSIYAEQDTIWFKAYLVNATLNNHVTPSALIYAEMINFKGEVVYTLSLPTTLGLTWGAIALKEELYHPGKYTFRAHTNWMKNFGNTYLFSKEITVLSTAQAPNPIVKTSAKIVGSSMVNSNRPSRAIDVQFLPEGGTWLNGISQKMAFKAINDNGKGIAVQGSIYDSQQAKVIDFSSNAKGMGFFILLPKANETYTAKITSPFSDLVKTLPKAQSTGVALQVALRDHPDSLRIEIVPVGQHFQQPLTVIGQSRGVLCFITTVQRGEGKKSFQVAKSIFPTGVSQVLVLNAQNQALNERNFFLDLRDQLQIHTSTPMSQYGSRARIPIALSVTDHLGKPVSGSFSVAVTADGQVAKDSINDMHILSYLLLTSDLKGEIETPGYYFHQPELPQTQNDLDALMLTQGWVSYQWTNEQPPFSLAEKEYSISGSVTNLMNKPSIGGHVTLMGRNKKSFMLIDTVTNAQGKFIFNNFPLLDSASFIIQAKNVKGKAGTLGILINEFERPQIIVPRNTVPTLAPLIDSVTVEFLASKNKMYEAAIKNGISLKEVKIVGKRSISGSKNLNGPGIATQILTESDLAPFAKKSLFDLLLAKIKGFREGGRPKTGTRDFFINADPARFIIDGIELDFFYSPSGGNAVSEYYFFVKSYLDYYSAEDIKGVETMENGYSFSYKNRFMEPMDFNDYAFIEVTTKTGSGPFLRKSANMYLIKPINYGNAMVFYSPKYTSQHQNDTLPDFRSTLFWHPNIVTNDKGEADFSFFSADQKGTYTVWIEGLDTTGGLGFKTMKLVIK